MSEEFIYKLKIDEGFKQLIPPLSVQEHQQLEQNIIHDGCLNPLCVWNNTILDGHNRYEICTRLFIPFMIKRFYFRHREEAIVWICVNQLGRRNISEETRKYLIGKRYETEKILGAHNALGINQHKQKVVRSKMLPEPPFDETFGRTRERLGEEYNISHASVFKYGKYADALDKLSGIIPEFVPKILSGEVKISQENVLEMSHMSEQNIRRLLQHLSDDSAEFSEYLRKVFPIRKDHYARKRRLTSTTSVKNMPVFDPDAELSGLTLTVPSWIRSMERASSITNFSKISHNARRNLKKELLRLSETINSMLATIKEDS